MRTLTLVGCLLASWCAAVCQAQDLAPRQESSPIDHDRIAADLRAVADAPSLDARTFQILAARNRLAVRGNLVDVEIELQPNARWSADVWRAVHGVETVFEGLDTYQGRNVPFVWARVPAARLRQLVADCPDIRYVRPPARGQAESITEGRGLTGAEANFHRLGFRGKGVRVAVIDLGFDRLADAIKAKALPAGLITRDFSGSGMEFNGSTREVHGVAVAEILYAMAPEAELYLLHVVNAAQLREAVDFCIQNKINVINHSVIWFNQSLYDGGGRISAIAADARDHGIVWVNAAGNSGRKHYDGWFNDTDDDNWHNFAEGDETINLSLKKGAVVTLYLTWGGWADGDGDYRLYLLDSRLDPDNPVSVSQARAHADSDPVQQLTATIPETGTYHIAIRRLATNSSHFLVLHAAGDLNQLDQYRVLDRSLADPAPSERVLAVGAVSQALWSDPVVEDFSSQGSSNSALMKPDLCGPDKVSGFAYGDGGFSGTSSASPHVAGAAALLWSRFPDSSAQQIRDLLEANASFYDGLTRTNACGAGLLRLPDTVSRPSIELTSNVRIVQPGPYYPGQIVTARFTITNRGTGCAFLRAVTAGGRREDGSVLDFPMRRNITLCAGVSYSYSESLTLPGVGKFHFFASFRGADGDWGVPLVNGETGGAIDVAAGAAPAALFGMDGNLGRDTARLLRIDRGTGSATVIGETTVLGINDIAMTNDGALWAVTASELYRMNPLNGAANRVGSTGYSGINALAADSSGVLYAATSFGELLMLDRYSGGAWLVGYFGIGAGISGDLAFAPDGRLYGTVRGTATDTLVRISLADGRASVIGPVGFPGVYGLAFDQSGTLFAVINGGSSRPQLARLNANSGAATIIGTIPGAFGMNGLTFGRDPSAWMVFSEDFESGTNFLRNDTWAVTTAQSHSPSHALTDSPSGSYLNDTNSSTFTPYFSLEGVNGATLTFWHRFDVEEHFDFCRVWITDDGGATWTTLRSFTGRTSGWGMSTIDLTAYAGERNLRLAFQLVSDSSVNGDGWYIDDVLLVGAR